MLFWVVVIFGTLLVGLVAIYNRLVRMIEEVNNNQRQIDLQLDRRFKVYQSLIEVVKQYFDYERTTLKEVVALRNQAQQAHQKGDEAERVRAEEAISKIGANVNLVFERYPELQADRNALQLQEEIVNTENRLTFAKQAYNDSVERYTASRKSVLESWVVALFPNKLLREFAYWGISEALRQQQEDYQIKF